MRRYLLIMTSMVALLCACHRAEPGFYRETGTRFHTIYHITYRSEKPLTEVIDSTMTSFNLSLNPFDSTSLITAINENKTDSIDTMIAEVVEKAAYVSRETNGVYDITGGPFFNIWGFGTKKGVTRYATPAQIDSIKAFVGYQKISLDTVAMRIHKADPRIDLIPSSLSKGYVVDLVGRALEAHGVQDYLVEIGGEITCNGKDPNGKCWQIGINKPVEDSTSMINEVLYRLPICEKKGLATSGDYRNYHLLDGKKVAHTIDVTTGYPAHQDILSASVLAPSCMEADAWATAFMALGLERSKELLQRHRELGVLFIYSDNEGHLKTFEQNLNFSKIDQTSNPKDKR